MSEELLGDEFSLNWDTADSYSTPIWVAQKSVGDIGLDTANEQVEIPKRIPVKTYKKGRGDWSLTFTMNIDRTNLFHMAVLDSLATGEKLHIAVAAGDVVDDPFWHGWWFLSGPIDAALDTGANVEVEGKCSFDIGVNDTEIPAYVPATP